MFGNFFDGLFGSGDNPAKKASPYLDKIPDYLKPYFEPYINAGQRALPNLESQYGMLMNDPGAMYNKFASGYQQSPGYQFRQQQGQGAAMNAAAAGGMGGSPEHEQRAAQMSNDIASQDFNDYMGKIMGMYGMGLGGQGELGKWGMESGARYGENLATNAQNQAMLQYMGQAEQNKGRNDFWNNIIGSVGGFFGGRR